MSSEHALVNHATVFSDTVDARLVTSLYQEWWGTQLFSTAYTRVVDLSMNTDVRSSMSDLICAFCLSCYELAAEKCIYRTHPVARGVI